MSMVYLRYSVCIFILLSFQACASGPQIKFTSDKSEINDGDVITLTWNAVDAERVSIEPNIGDVAIDSYIKLSPKQSTDYVLTASNNSGVTSQQITVKVVPFVDFSFKPLTLAGEKYIALKWKVKGAHKVSISPNVGTVDTYGMKIAPLAYSNNFTLTAEAISGDSKSKKLIVRSQGTDDLERLIKTLSTSGTWKTTHRIVEIGSSAVPLLISELEIVLAAEQKIISLVDTKKTKTLTQEQNNQLSRYISTQLKILFIFGKLQAPETVSVILELAKNTSSNAAMQIDIFRALLNFKDNSQVKEYFTSILNSDESSALQLRWALFSLLNASNNEKFVMDYATKFMDKKYDLSVREVAVLIAAEQGVDYIKPIIISLLKEEAEPEWKNSALYALAIIAEPNELIEVISTIDLEPEQKLAAIGVSRLNLTSLEEKEQAVKEVFQSHSYLGRRNVLEYVFENNRVDLLEKYSILMPLDERTWYSNSLHRGIYIEPLKLLPLLFKEDDVKLIESFKGLVKGTAMKPILSVMQHDTERKDNE